MPTNQIVPEHEYPHVMVVETDNSQRPATRAVTQIETYCNMLFVFSSPKGVDREMRTCSSGYEGFIETYGVGSFDQYGQPFLNALAAAKTDAATLHCLRVTADDAAYAVGALVAHYKATPGTEEPIPPVVTPSDKVNVFGHANVVATDTVDETTGAITVSIAGTNVTAGISEANKAVFGEPAVEAIDIGLDLTKMMVLDPTKNYKVTQTNPALAAYLGKDEFITEVNGTYVKEKTYTGAALAEGYALLIGADATATLSIVEWGAVEPPVEIYIVNNTDMDLKFADKFAHANVAKTGSDYKVTTSGEVVAGVINAALWGKITGNYIELDLIMPVQNNADVKYRVVQKNPALAAYSKDPTISQVDGVWTKSKAYSGVDIVDGYAILMGEDKADIVVKFYEDATFVSETESTPLFTVTVTNGFSFVAEHVVENTPGPIGDPVNVSVVSTLAFTTTVAKSSLLRAQAATNKITRAITGEGVPATPGKMEIYYTFEGAEAPVTSLDNLGNLVPVTKTPDENGYTAVKMFEIACRGRGAYGNNVRFILDSYARGDRMSNYKNYTLSVAEIQNATLSKKEEFTVSFIPDSVSSSGNTLFIDHLVGNPYANSEYVTTVTNPTAIKELFAIYQSIFPSTGLTENTFDPITGYVFGISLTKIEGLVIDTVSNGTVSVSGSSGVALLGGSDGEFSMDNANRQEALNKAYLKAYSGEIDRNIKSCKMFPTDIILDAGFEVETKAAIADLVRIRKDVEAIYDIGTNFNTFAGVMENLADLEPFINSRDEAIECYRGKIQDPTTFKIVNMTGTYALAAMYPDHFRTNGGKHVPLAGSSYGVMKHFLSGTAFPVFDDGLDQDSLDILTNSHVNYLKVNTLKQVVRGSQTTRQDVDTNLSELSNVFILHDIRRDAIQLCEQYEYNFAEASDMQRFNKAAGILADKYKDKQVSSIEATFSMTDWESERGILHLTINFVHKNIIKRAIVEININRGTVEQA